MEQLKRVWRGFSKNRRAQIFVALLLSAALFGLGVEVGNGNLQISLFSAPQTHNANLPATLDYSSVNQVYQVLKANYNGKVSTSQLLDGLKEGLASATNDPYTVYFNPQQAQAFSDELNNSFSGIGAELGKDDQGNLIVVAPIKGFPADTAGLKAQDIITAINGQSTAGVAIDTAVNEIRGQQGTKVTLQVVRNKSATLSFTITRENIKLPSVTTKTLDGNIGYMQIISFANDTALLAQKAAAQFQAAHVKGIILDLRGNPGGLLTAAVDVSSLWLPQGKTVVTEKGTVGTQTSTAAGNNVLNGIPTVVLIDDGSASASEITAGALHDDGAAYLIGTKSYGKGVVQQLINLKDGGQLKVTVANWYRPNGQNINKQGITPDQIVSISDADVQAGIDSQLQAAESYLNK